MKRVVLVDGNNLLFRSYYATAYSGNFMKNSKGFPTNGLYGFVNMMNKIIKDEEPTHIMVAFDKGKTFRHVNYTDYKGGRQETPVELKEQFPVAKDILNALGIKYVEIDMYEADDIIGTYARVIDETDDYEGLIVSSDKDLLQLISSKVKVKLLKSQDYIMMDRDKFYETYGVEPIRMIDLKGLIGDPSDNIPGVKGIGEKTGTKLLVEYGSLENIYANVDKIKGSVHDKLLNDRDNAFMSKTLATICKDVPIDVDFDDLLDKRDNNDDLINIYKDLEFFSFLKNIEVKKEAKEDISKDNGLEVKIVAKDKLEINDDVAIFLDMDLENYHKGNILGMSIYGKNISYYVPVDNIKNIKFLGKIYTYDVKKVYVALKKIGVKLDTFSFDTMIAGYLLNYNVKDDIGYLATSLGFDIDFTDYKKPRDKDKIINDSIKKAKFIYDSMYDLDVLLVKEEMKELYYDIELPLAIVLGKMELEGIKVDTKILKEMREELNIKIELISNEIYNHAGEIFNISSPKQLGEILFNKLGIPYVKKNATKYSTDVTVLEKLSGKHPIIDRILEYRMLTKLSSTYVIGLLNSVMDDGKIHTIYNQTLTRTGRLSSVEPNLQNIPIRQEYGRLIRKAFVPDVNAFIVSSDYSQIELRVFAHLANVDGMIEAFNNNEDIHTHTASQLFRVDEADVTSSMRRQAKAVNFGILYGMSTYGLSEELHISPVEAKTFIEKYFNTYPGIKFYMDNVVREAKDKGYVRTLMNRKRVIDELYNKNFMIRTMGERMALNTGVQGTSADILKKAMILIDKEIDKRNLKSKMLLQVHDELIFNVYENELDEMKDIIRDIMENAYKLSVPLTTDINVGNNWYEAK